MKPAIRFRRRPGFSLIEIVTSLAILTAVSGGVCALFCSSDFGAAVNGDESAAMADAETALRGMAADLRGGSALAAPANEGGVRVSFADGSAIEYYQTGTTLQRVAGSGSPATRIVTDLAAGTGLTLTYYDSGMNVLAGSMDSSRYAQAAVVDVTVTIPLAHAALGQVTRTTRVVLRNRVGAPLAGAL